MRRNPRQPVEPLRPQLDVQPCSAAALTGSTFFSTIPVAASVGDGTFTRTNGPASNFAGWAALAGAKILSGDFNGDGRTDLALTGPAGFTTIPIAFSDGDGTFTISNQPVDRFSGWAAIDRAKVLTGDFNHDGKTGLVATGVPGFTTIPVALSNGNEIGDRRGCLD